MTDFRRFFVPVAGAVIISWEIWWLWLDACYDVHEVRGQVGDMFGGVNALFSGLALAGVVTAVTLQSKELQLQRQELELTRTELKRAAEANQKAAEALRDQVAMQLKAAELSAISTLLSSVNNQLAVNSTGTDRNALQATQEGYEDRLRAILAEMGRGIP